MELEKSIESAILAYLASQTDVIAFKVNTMGTYDQRRQCYRKPSKYVLRGTADIIACLNVQGIGIFIAMEVKSAVGVQSEYQKNFAYRVRNQHGFYFLVRSIHDAERALDYARQFTLLKLSNTPEGVV
jgi:hypothetical protein